MPSLALVRRRAALIAVCAVRALSTTSERLKQLGRHASIEIAPRQATRHAELAKARPKRPAPVFVNFVDTEDEHFAAVEAACAVLKAAGLDRSARAGEPREERGGEAAAAPARRRRRVRADHRGQRLDGHLRARGRRRRVRRGAAGYEAALRGLSEATPTCRAAARASRRSCARTAGASCPSSAGTCPSCWTRGSGATRGDAEAIFVGVPGPAPRATLRRFYELVRASGRAPPSRRCRWRCQRTTSWRRRATSRRARRVPRRHRSTTRRCGCICARAVEWKGMPRLRRGAVAGIIVNCTGETRPCVRAPIGMLASSWRVRKSDRKEPRTQK